MSRVGQVQTSKIIRWFNFNAVGAIGIVVQLGVLSILTSGMHVNYLAATALSVQAAILHNFFWHEKFTWKDRVNGGVERSFARLLRFNLTAGLLSIGGNLVLMRLFVGMLDLNYFVANLLTIAVCSLANFLVSDQVVFRQREVVLNGHQNHF